MKTIELLNIEDLNKLVGGDSKESLTDIYEVNESLTDIAEKEKTVSKSLSYDFSKLAELTK